MEEGREKMFCSYCGSQVIMTNENEYIYRHIDEAGIKQAETDRIVKLRELEMESQENGTKKILIAVWLVSTAVLLLLGVIGMNTDSEGLMMCMLLGMCVGMWGGIGIFGLGKKKKRTVVSADEAIISESMANYNDKNFNTIAMLYKSAGFMNVNTVPMNDLNLFTMKNNGKVDSVSINGEEDFDEGDVFSKNSHITITYHSGK
ncbi:MAG: hypothetical protein GX567_05160 [Clostridia bacterium]|nr:hypothetical protein [Clostridia bacterium]